MTGKRTLSSLPLEVLLFFNKHYVVLYSIINVCLYIYKSVRYYYPSLPLGFEITAALCFVALEYCRIFLASQGNKTENLRPLLISILLLVPTFVYYAYQLELQTYVLRVDLITNSIGVAITGLEAVFIVLMAINLRYSYRRL